MRTRHTSLSFYGWAVTKECRGCPLNVSAQCQTCPSCITLTDSNFYSASNQRLERRFDPCSSTSLGPHAEQPRLGFFEPQEFVALDLERVLEQPPHRPEQSAIA